MWRQHESLFTYRLQAFARGLAGIQAPQYPWGIEAPDQEAWNIGRKIRDLIDRPLTLEETVVLTESDIELIAVLDAFALRLLKEGGKTVEENTFEVHLMDGLKEQMGR